MHLSIVTKVVLGFAFGAIVGGTAMSAIATINDSGNQLSAELARSSSKIGESHLPPPPACTPPPDRPNDCPTSDSNQPPPPPPNTGSNPDPNLPPPPAGGSLNPPPTGQTTDPNQKPGAQPNQPGQTNPNQPGGAAGQNGQPGQPGQFGQPGQPFNAASTNIGRPPELSFQQPAGLQDPKACFEAKGGPALAEAVRSGKMTPAQMSSAGSCFSANFNAAGGSGQGAPGQGGAPGQPFGQMAIFSGDFIKTMSNVKPPANDCVARIAGEAVADKMFSQGVQPDNDTRDKIFQAGCFGPPPGGGQAGANGQPGAPGRQFAGPPLEVVDCLNKIPGNGDVQSGKRTPTPAEFSAGQACYAKAGATPFFVPPGQVPENSPLALCAKAVIGVTDISTITPNSLTRDQKQRMRQCYAPAGEQAMANTQPSLPQEAADCVKKILGETAFSQVSTGKLEPTVEQRKAVGAACFQKKALSKIAELSEAAVPLTQTQALMADVDTELVAEPTVISPTTEEVSADPDAATFELTGQLGDLADVQTVDIYYNSDASIVTTAAETADSGQKTWSTKVAYSSLPQDEEHTLYAVMTKSDGTAVRSPLVAFEAKAAESASESAVSAGTNRNMLILYSVLGLLVLGAITSWVIIRRKHRLAV